MAMQGHRKPHRREWIRTACGSLVSLLHLDPWRALAAATGDTGHPYRITRHRPTGHYDGRTFWCHPRAGIVPGAGRDGMPRIVMTFNTMDVTGNDVFRAMDSMHSDDLGATWTPPRLSEPLAPRRETISGQECPVALSDFWPTWHASSAKLLGTGHTVVYTPDWKITHPRPRHTAYSTYAAATDVWSSWQRLEMPDGPEYLDSGAGCTQRWDERDGSILLPFYFRPPGENSRVAVARLILANGRLSVREIGDAISVDDTTRGLHEPSLTRFNDWYFLTIRHDERGYVTRSRDGLRFEPLRIWKFNDGAELGNYNTQQHWGRHDRGGLHLVYTRRGAANDHVFRHRAPLFMARVDTERLCVIRESESILVPERGARLGNFGVTEISSQETWVTVSEWMQTWRNGILPVDNPYGADGAIWIARITWDDGPP